MPWPVTEKRNRNGNAVAFDEPSEAALGDRLDLSTIVDKLIIVRPKSYTDKQVTIHKPDGAEAIFGNVAVLQPHEGEPWKIYRGVMFMQGYLISAFKGKMPRDLLGTIYKGVATKGKPPFMFKSLTGNAKAVEMAQAWMAVNEAEFYADAEPGGFDEPTSAGPQRSQWDDEPPF